MTNIQIKITGIGRTILSVSGDACVPTMPLREWLNLPYHPAACTAEKTNTLQGYLFLCIKIGCRASGEILALK